MTRQLHPYNNLMNGTPHSYYWGGWLMTDCTCHHSNYEVALDLQALDKNQVYIFHSAMGWNTAISERSRHLKKKDGSYRLNTAGEPKVYLSFVTRKSNKVDYVRLMAFYGISMHTAKTYQTPDVAFLRRLTFDEFLCFITGYIDGDGWIAWSTEENPSNGYKLRIKQHLLWAKYLEVIDEIICKEMKLARTEVIVDDKEASLIYSADKAKRVLRLIKRNALKYKLPVLARKWDKVAKYCSSTKTRTAKTKARRQLERNNTLTATPTPATQDTL